MSTLKTMYPGQVNSPFTTTLGEISTTDTAVVVADASVLPDTLPYLLTLGFDKSASETVLVTKVTGNTLTITRAVDGYALLWVAGTKAARIFTAKDLNDIQENIRTLNAEKQENLTLDTAPQSGSGNPITSGGVFTALAKKQDALTFDSAPKQNSGNPVTSGGVYSALAKKQDSLTFDSAPKQNSGNPVVSGGVYTALVGKQATLTFDSTPTKGSTNPVTSGGVQSEVERINTALAGKQAKLTFDTTPTQGSTNPVTSGGVHTALSAKANAASLSAHTGNRSNPHGVTPAQIGAATPAQVTSAIDDISEIGDLRTTLATPSNHWLPCDGRGVYSKDYPDLVPVLQAGSPMFKELTIPSSVYGSGQKKYSQGVAYRNGYWAMVGSGYGNSQNLYIPVLYYTNDPDGTWWEKRLVASGSYWLSGILYNPRWSRWVAYGYKYVSNTECYPYIFYATSLGGSWFGLQVSNTLCKVTAGYFADNKLVLIGVGCGSANSKYGYAYTAATTSISFTENNFTTSLSKAKGLCYGDGYWAFAESSRYIRYTTDPTGTWTQKAVTYDTGVYLANLCYGDGIWCAVGMQSSGGSGRLFYASSPVASFTDVGITDSNDGNEVVKYCDGVFVVVTLDLGSSAFVLVSTDRCATWKKIRIGQSGMYDLVCSNGKWLICGMYNSIVLNHPEADAVLPELSPEIGKTYIKAL